MKTISPKVVAVIATFALIFSVLPPLRSARAASTLTFGAETVFETGDSTYIDVAALSETTVVISYRDEGNSNRGTAVVGIISGNSISFGTPVVFYNDNASYVAITKLDSDSVAIAFTDVDNDASAIIGDVTGNSITLNTAAEFTADSTTFKDISRLDDTHFLVAWNNTIGTQLDGAVGTVSAGSISYGSTATFDGDSASSISIAGLSATRAIVVANDFGTSTRGMAHGITISGGSMTAVDSFVMNASASTFISAVPFNSTQAFVLYNANSEGNSAIETVSTGLVSPRDTGAFDATNVTRMAATLFPGTSTSFTAYRSADSKGKAIIGTVGATTHTFDSPSTFTESSFNNVGAAAISATQAVIAYQDNSNSGRGTALVATYGEAAAASSAQGGGGNAAWLVRLRQQNGLDAQGNRASSSSSHPASASSSSLSSSSSASAVNHRAATSSSISSSSSSASSFASKPTVAREESSLKTRTCERVMKWFKKDSGTLNRLNARLLKAFGFQCVQ